MKRKICQTAGKKGPTQLLTSTRNNRQRFEDRLEAGRKAALAKRRLSAENVWEEELFMSPTTTITATTCDTTSTIDSLNTVIASEIHPAAMHYAKGGLSYTEFIEGRHDFRKWGATTFQGFVESGDREFFLNGLKEYKQRSKRGGPKHFLVVALDDLPLSAATADFMAQKSGLEEVYDAHNLLHGTSHRCVFLPKFHPELNPIERVWSKMKSYVRNVADGKILTLRDAMKDGLSEPNLPIATIRRYCRVVSCYYTAYGDGMDIVTAQKWMQQHRSHRGYAKVMDARLEAIYHPLGRPSQNEDSVETSVPITQEEEESDLTILLDTFEATQRFLDCE